jgi:hypothetical protein
LELRGRNSSDDRKEKKMKEKSENKQKKIVDYFSSKIGLYVQEAQPL